MYRTVMVVFGVLVGSLVTFQDLCAQWVPDGVAVCTAPNGQGQPDMVLDGAGGVIITWGDYRSGVESDIYAQRVSAGGVSQWAADGAPVCTAANDQSGTVIVSDGSGGAIVAWVDRRAGPPGGIGYADIYAQRIDASGVPQWTTDGVQVCTVLGDQLYLAMLSHGVGGAIIAWTDYRPAATASDIYSQRISASGVPQWTPDGILLCTAPNNQGIPAITSDGAGGAIVAWSDYRNSSNDPNNGDIYAQRVNSAGVVQWTANGVPVCTVASIQYQPDLISDGSGGVIATWQDIRDGVSGDIYAQRLNAAGNRLWTASGLPVSTAPNHQLSPTLVEDGAGGAIITWGDYRSGVEYDIYAQRISAGGASQWAADGVAVCAVAGWQVAPTIAADGSGGAVVTWYDQRPGLGPADIYAQRISASGSTRWAADGVALCTAAGDQFNPVLVGDGTGGATVAWYDVRSLNSANSDIYAQRVTGTGVVAPLVSVQDLTPSLVTFRAVPTITGGSTFLAFGRQLDVPAEVQILDVSGRTVRTLKIPASRGGVTWDGTDDAGSAVGSGLYFVKLSTLTFTATTRVVVVR